MSNPRVPNFFIAGVPDAGTTALHFTLGQHPEIFVSPLKEPTFFGSGEALAGAYGEDVRNQVQREHAAVRAYLGASAKSGALEWEEYLKLFRNARGEPAIGEASVRYFRLRQAPQEIRSRLPHAKLIFMLRDPAERVFSRFLGNRWRHGQRRFAPWFETAKAPGSSWEPVVDGGRYATHLDRFFKTFPRDQLRIYLYEDYRTDAAGLLKDLFAFLDVDPTYPVDLSRRHNETVVPRVGGLEQLRQHALGRRSTLGWLPARARGALRWLYYRPRPVVTMPPADRQLVIEYYRDEIVRTSELIGRDLSQWLLPHPPAPSPLRGEGE